VCLCVCVSVCLCVCVSVYHKYISIHDVSCVRVQLLMFYIQFLFGCISEFPMCACVCSVVRVRACACVRARMRALLHACV